MLKIIDLKVGNIGSVIKAINHLGVEYQLISNPKELDGADKIIMPGVGSFFACATRLKESGFIDALKSKVLEEQVPILGICVGMQLLANLGEEGGGMEGLGFINGTVKKLNSFDGELIIPHMGWNDIEHNGGAVFSEIPDNSCFYFVHSYAMTIDDDSEADIATVNYGEDVVAYVNKGHIHGAQFHPEKSQAVGLKFLRNFIELC